MLANVDNALERMLQLQAEQQRNWFNDPALMTDAERRAVHDELLHGLHEEVGELARELRSKPHVARFERPSRGNKLEEWTDCLKYLLAIAHTEGFTADELLVHFEAKTQDVQQRHRQRTLERSGQRVLVTDLDACVADIVPFLQATGAMYGGKQAGTKETEMKKHQWYDAAGFLELPAIPGAREALQQARDEGCLIAIITARPVWEHSRVRTDTVAWLRANDIPHDILLFNKDKWDALYQHVLPAKVIGFVEDRPKHIMELAGHRVNPLFLMTAEWNKDFETNGHSIQRVHTWSQIRHQLAATNWGRCPEEVK